VLWVVLWHAMVLLLHVIILFVYMLNTTHPFWEWYFFIGVLLLLLLLVIFFFILTLSTLIIQLSVSYGSNCMSWKWKLWDNTIFLKDCLVKSLSKSYQEVYQVLKYCNFLFERKMEGTPTKKERKEIKYPVVFSTKWIFNLVCIHNASYIIVISIESRPRPRPIPSFNWNILNLLHL